MVLVMDKTCKEEAEKDLKAMRRAAKRIASSEETARTYLLKHGFITKSGKLTKRYGG